MKNKIIGHTPGPWNEGRGRINEKDPAFYRVDVLNSSKTIRVAIASGVGQDVAEANARLIAAAPELLEAAKELVDHLSKMENGKWLNNRPGDLLERAIAKATGKK